MQHVAACFVHPQPFNYVPFPLVLWKELGNVCRWPPAPSGGVCGQQGPHPAHAGAGAGSGTARELLVFGVMAMSEFQGRNPR